MANLQLIPKNFTSENHKIEYLLQQSTLSIFYKVKTKYGFETEKFFVTVFTKDNYYEKLQELLQRVEDYSGIKLLKSPLKIVTNDREHSRAV
jgi:hypothetical protein